jgi:putative tricarboxylic transport membrane protein
MKLSDALSGALFIILGLFMLWQASLFPVFSGQPYGAELLPSILGGAFVLGGGGLILRDLARRRAASANGAGNNGIGSDAWISVIPELQTRSGIAALAAVLAYILGQVWIAPMLGFTLVSIVTLTVLFAVLNIRLWVALLLGVAASLACWFLFAELLRVPLPRGLLGGVI